MYGVHQELISGPLLVFICKNDIVNSANANDTRLYADDACVFYS